jgi:hypothetical protein
MHQRIIVESIAHLKKLCNVDGFGEFFILLDSGIRSSKRICYDSEDKTFNVHHEIDDSWDECITEEELYELTNIPEAIEKKALILDGYDYF